MNSITKQNGLVAFIGSTNRKQPVLIKWVPCGGELELLDAVRASGEERALVLGTADATQQDVKRLRARNRGELASRMLVRSERCVARECDDLRRVRDGMAASSGTVGREQASVALREDEQ